MMSFLKDHPFAVETHFESSTVLTFAIPKEELEGLIPECLELDTFEDEFAFIAVAMVKTKNLRPKGFPKILGNDFFLIGYRVFVRYRNNKGKRLRGLYILKSETNKKKMELLGNIFTHYNYTTTDISTTKFNDFIIIESEKSDFTLKIDTKVKETELPLKSPFIDWKEARKFAGPLPFTFTYSKPKNKVLIIEGVRQKWKPKAIKITNYNFSYLKSFNFTNCILASAFVIEDVPYYWKKGKVEKWIK